jgi:hypothetical protein
MADQDQDSPELERQVARAYRELPREEPPEALDAAIRAEARRSAATRPAPLVSPTGRRGWHYPFAAAAVLVLAVAVTWHVEREQPDMVATAPPASVAPVPAEPAPAQKAPEAKTPQRERVAPKVQGPERAGERAQPRADASPQFVPDPATTQAQEAKREQVQPERPAPPAPMSVPAPAERPAVEQQKQRAASGAASDSVGASRDAAELSKRQMRSEAENRVGAAAVVEPPERWLERIAQLRREGKHEEADKALAEFRKRYPDFRIPAETLEKVERR